MKKSFWGLVLALVLMMSSTVYGEGAGQTQITKGKKVRFNYTLTVDGKVVDSSEGHDPLQYIQGQHQIIPGLEKQLEGLKVGDEKEATIKPEEGYGPVDPKAYAEVPKNRLPQGDLKVGMQLHTVGKDGQPIYATISEVKEESVMMNFNHPLAGKELHFKVKVVEIV